MSSTPSTDLGRALVRFFEDYLPSQRGASQHTIRSYRDTVVLLLQFTARYMERRIEHLRIADIRSQVIKQFLKSLDWMIPPQYAATKHSRSSSKRSAS
jgi:integrase/recombinase XerD